MKLTYNKKYEIPKNLEFKKFDKQKTFTYYMEIYERALQKIWIFKTDYEEHCALNLESKNLSTNFILKFNFLGDCKKMHYKKEYCEKGNGFNDYFCANEIYEDFYNTAIYILKEFINKSSYIFRHIGCSNEDEFFEIKYNIID